MIAIGRTVLSGMVATRSFQFALLAIAPGRSTLADPLDEKFVERVPAAHTTRLPLVLLTLAAYPR